MAACATLWSLLRARIQGGPGPSSMDQGHPLDNMIEGQKHNSDDIMVLSKVYLQIDPKRVLAGFDVQHAPRLLRKIHQFLAQYLAEAKCGATVNRFH